MSLRLDRAFHAFLIAFSACALAAAEQTSPMPDMSPQPVASPSPSLVLAPTASPTASPDSSIPDRQVSSDVGNSPSGQPLNSAPPAPTLLRTDNGCTCGIEIGNCVVRDARGGYMTGGVPAAPPGTSLPGGAIGNEGSCPCAQMLQALPTSLWISSCGYFQTPGWTPYQCDGGTITQLRASEPTICDCGDQQLEYEQTYLYDGQPARVECRNGRVAVFALPDMSQPRRIYPTSADCYRAGGSGYGNFRSSEYAYAQECRCADGRVLASPWDSCGP